MPFSYDLKCLVRAASNWHRQGSKPNIALFATPRGGSTWVMDLLASERRTKFYDEPLNLRRDNVKRTGLFDDWTELFPEAIDRHKVLSYLSGLSKGKYGFMNPAPFRKNHRVFTDRIIYKIHAIEHMINDVRDQCDCQILYLLRHPVSNTLSRNVFPRLDYFLASPYYMEEILSREQSREVRDIAARGSRLKRGILSWCFENTDVHRNQDKKNWVVLSYEELVLRTAEICQILCDRLDLVDRDRIGRAGNQASSNIRMSAQVTQRVIEQEDGDERAGYLVSRWRKQVTSSDERKYLSILELFNIDFYRFGRDLVDEKYLLCNARSSD